jgi:outer membrane protein OmpA-like peptidoglycan-associated protein
MRPFAKVGALALLATAAIAAPALAQDRDYQPGWTPDDRGDYVDQPGPPTPPPDPRWVPDDDRGYGYPPPPRYWRPAPPPYGGYETYEEDDRPAPPPPRAAPNRPARLQPRDFVIYFNFDGDQLDGDSERIIEEAVHYARAYPDARIAIIGYTDAAGAEDYNQDLSKRRSEAVRQALVARGADSDSIEMDWRGKHDQAVRTPDGVREQANRRVTIEIGDGGATAVDQHRYPTQDPRYDRDDRE